MDDDRGQLVNVFLSLLKDIQPKQFIFENVKGLLTYDKGAVFEWIKKSMKDMGYKISHSVI